MRRGGRVLNERATAKRSNRQAAYRRDAVDEARAPGRVGRVQVDERGAECREGRAGGDPLRDPSDEKDGDISRDEEQDEGQGFQRYGRRQDRAATDVVGKTTEHEQRADQTEDVDREDEGERRVGESPFFLIDDVKRRRRACSRREDHKDGRNRREGNRPRKAAGTARRRVLRIRGGHDCSRHTGATFYFSASARRAAATMSAPVLACPWRPQPPSGDSVIKTQVRSVSRGSPAAAATMSVSSLTTPSCLSRSRTPTGVSTCTRT